MNYSLAAAFCFSILLPSQILAFSAAPLPERPQTPEIMRDMAMVNDDKAFTHPVIPGNRSTQDGRITLVQEGGPGIEWGSNYRFALHIPEAVNQPIMPGPNGATILNALEPVLGRVPHNIPTGGGGNFHHNICDATEPFYRSGEQPNPYACGADGKNDCYDITVMTATRQGLTDTSIWGTEVRIEVENPKTLDARIVDVQVENEATEGAFLPWTPNFNEPATTEDGRLLVGRRGGVGAIVVPIPFAGWRNPETGEVRHDGYELMYSLLPEDAKPCDVTGWKEFHPMSHAPYDPQMKKQGYGIAAYPFRDGEGNAIADGEDLAGTYPWLDRQGANVFMSGISGHIAQDDQQRFPWRCAHSDVDCASFLQPADFDRGQMVAGLWTHGKFVLLDAMINHIDWAVGIAPHTQFVVDLYKDTDNEDVPVRIGGGRFVESLRVELQEDPLGNFPAGYTFNANILDSVQNIFNYKEELKPVTPRDVTWLMSNGVSTDEIVFDDYLDPNAFIVSNMQASITRGIRNISGSNTPQYHDGKIRNVYMGAYNPTVNHFTGGREDIHLQNAATSLDWQVPGYGLVKVDTGRVEPVALGGIKGKGFWLNGENQISYTIPAQEKKIANHDWYISLFIDPRKISDKAVSLINFPDGSEIRLVNRDTEQRIQYLLNNQVLEEMKLPQRSLSNNEGWRHLAWQLSKGNTKVRFMVDGFTKNVRKLDQALFQMVPGELTLGSHQEDLDAGYDGFKGWIDEFKVLAHRPNLEVACNHAHGTLVAIDQHDDLSAQASRYPLWTHRKLQNVVQDHNASRFACLHDYSQDWGAHLAAIPEGTRSIRDAINFPEGPLKFGHPRPDSSDNKFCLSCHHANAKGGLGLEALSYDSDVNVEYDHRRQPNQPPRRVFGNIPANWIPPGAGPGSPAQATEAGRTGALIDEWVLQHE